MIPCPPLLDNDKTEDDKAETVAGPSVSKFNKVKEGEAMDLVPADRVSKIKEEDSISGIKEVDMNQQRHEQHKTKKRKRLRQFKNQRFHQQSKHTVWEGTKVD